MEQQNPYQAPSTDVSPQYQGETDQTGPFSPSGRFGRLSFLAWGTIIAAISNIVTAIFGGSEMFVPTFDEQGMPIPPDFDGTVLAIFAVVGLVSLVFGIIFSIRRCHDFNGSGWLSLLLLIPLVNIVFLLVLWFKRGDQGANSYGPPRVTPGWETVVGITGAVLIVIMLGLTIFSIAAGLMMATSGGLEGLS